jgi:hypothetical protein
MDEKYAFFDDNGRVKEIEYPIFTKPFEKKEHWFIKFLIWTGALTRQYEWLNFHQRYIMLSLANPMRWSIALMIQIDSLIDSKTIDPNTLREVNLLMHVHGVPVALAWYRIFGYKIPINSEVRV